MNIRTLLPVVIVYFITCAILHIAAYYYYQQVFIYAVLVSSAIAFWQITIVIQAVNEDPIEKIGIANWLTLIRGILLLVASSSCFFNSSYHLQLGIAILYTLAVTLDGIDGYIARKTNTVTKAGTTLDVEFDAQAVLMGTCAGIWFGALPLWFIPVGILRYLSEFGKWMVQKWGRNLVSAPKSVYRRRLAGLHMGLIALSVYPLVSGIYLKIIATVFMVPFCLMFLRDWPIEVGFFREETESYQSVYKHFRSWYFVIVPVLLRISLIAVLIKFSLPLHYLIPVALLVTGIFCRSIAIGLLASLVFCEPLWNNFTAILTLYCSYFVIAGPGKFFAYSPEENWDWGQRQKFCFKIKTLS